MIALVAFDVDGTLDSSAGPVPVDRLRAMEAMGVAVVIVSPSAARPPGFPEEIGEDRAENLRRAAQRFPAVLRLYVSDNGDRAAAVQAGFAYIDRDDFAASGP